MPDIKDLPMQEAWMTSSGRKLLARAESMLREQESQSLEHATDISTESTMKLLHDLRVHQIELEMQNEELHRTRAELDVVKERYFDLYDLAPVGYFTVSEAGLILQANLTGATLLGLPRADLVEQPITRFILDADQDVFYLLRKQVSEYREAQLCELRMWKKDRSSFWASMAATTATEINGSRVILLVVTDVSDHKQYEHKLQEANIALESAKAVAERANMAKSEFLSSMSHELRTPLNAVLGFAQLMASSRPPPSAEQQLSIEQILKAGWHLLNLINEILDFAMIESGNMTILQSAMSVGDVLLDCQAMMNLQASKREIKMTFPRFANPIYLFADRNRVKQIIINLLSNAIKYNRVGGAVTVECATCDVNRVRISVTDSGYGLTPEQLSHLFQPFNRFGQETKLEEGTGIGLVITKRLIELMGGRIGASSSVGVGSVFWVELPTASEPESIHSGTADLEQMQSENMQDYDVAPQRTLLCVEDNPANLALIEQLTARRADLKLLTAVDGYTGVRLARLYRPDVILMDINLPDISGFDALRILREDPATAHIPVMALSANAISQDIEKGLRAGFFCYLTKPIKVKELTEALDVALHYAKGNISRKKQK